MANEEHLEILRQGVDAWNQWRKDNPETRPDLTRADLTGAKLRNADLTRADLTGANIDDADLDRANLTDADLTETTLSEAYLTGAKLTRAKLTDAYVSGAHLRKAQLADANLRGAGLYGADLTEADLTAADLTRATLNGATLFDADLTEADLTEASLDDGADLMSADLTKADLTKASLAGADLTDADLTRATLCEADLRGAQVVGTTLTDCDLTGSYVYGTSVWDPIGQPRAQRDLVITPSGEPVVTVDDLKVSQFIYLLLSNANIRDVIDTITSKVVLILGRFTEERKTVLDALREELRQRNFTPVLFDFDPAENQDITDTVTLLARMARFVIADLTEPMSVQQELTLIAPDVLVAIRPIIREGHEPWAMFDGLKRRSHGLLSPFTYRDIDHLLENLEGQVIDVAEGRRTELLPAIQADMT